MKKILFLCTGNSCRSQMAEGFCRHLWGTDYMVFSAGTKKHGMNERAMQVMKEIGIDISAQYSKSIEELPDVTFDFVVTVCDAAKESCPYFPCGKLIHLSFQDPPALTKEMVDEEEIIKVYFQVRDEIAAAIKLLPKILSNE